MLSYSVTAHTSQRNSKSRSWEGISAIEKRFPRISNELTALWKKDGIDHYIDGLLLDDRGDRMGFPIDVLEELMFLAGIRWHVSHLCGTLIETTSAEEFSYSGNRAELCGSNSATWVLV